MNCEHCERKLPDFLVHRLDPKVASAVQLHLGTCGPCREALGRVRRLYAVPEAFRARPPARLMPPRRRPRALRRAAAAAIGVAAAGLVLFLGLRAFDARVDSRSLRSGTDSARAEDTGAAPLAALEPIRVSLPAPPPDFRPGAWLSSRADAQRLAAYTGRAILEEYVWPGCPRCKGMEEVLQPDYLPILDDFILVRQYADAGLPEELLAAHPDAPANAVYPAMRVVEDDCETKPVWSVNDLTTVEDVVADYYAGCFLLSEDERAPLDRELYDWARTTLESVPALVDEGRFQEAFERLDDARALDASYRTRFAADAAAAERQLHQALEQHVAALEARAAQGPAQRATVRTQARALRDELRGLPLFERVDALAR